MQIIGNSWKLSLIDTKNRALDEKQRLYYPKRIFAKNYIEVYLKANLEIVIKRDTKGLYKKHLSENKINMIGLDPRLPYEEPDRSEIVINTDYEKPEESLIRLIQLLALF